MRAGPATGPAFTHSDLRWAKGFEGQRRADLGEATLHFYATTCAEADVRTTLDIVGTKGRASWDSDKAVVKIDGKDEIVFRSVEGFEPTVTPELAETGPATE